MSDSGADPDELRRAIWAAANRVDLSDEQRSELKQLMGKQRAASAEFKDLLAAREDFVMQVRSVLSARDQLVPGLARLFEGGRTPSKKEIEEHIRNSVADAEAIRDQPLSALAPSGGLATLSRGHALAEYPDDVYKAMGRLVIRFGQLEESVNMLLFYLGGETKTLRSEQDLFTDELHKKRGPLRTIARECVEKGLLTEQQQAQIDEVLDLTATLATERRRFIHAGYMLPENSPTGAGWIRQADRGKPISLKPLDVGEITDLSDRIEAAAEEGWSLLYEILETNSIGSGGPVRRQEPNAR